MSKAQDPQFWPAKFSAEICYASALERILDQSAEDKTIRGMHQAQAATKTDHYSLRFSYLYLAKDSLGAAAS